MGAGEHFPPVSTNLVRHSRAKAFGIEGVAEAAWLPMELFISDAIREEAYFDWSKSDLSPDLESYEDGTAAKPLSEIDAFVPDTPQGVQSKHISYGSALSSALYPTVPTVPPHTVRAPVASPSSSSSSSGGVKFRSALVLSNLLLSVWNSAEYLKGDEQHDAHEFFLALLDGYSVHLDKFHGIPHSIRPPPSLSPGIVVDPAPVNGGYVLKGILNDTFAGILRSKLTCRGCGHCSTKYEPFLDISLSVDNIKRRHSTMDTSISLEDCLRQWCAVEFLNATMTCESCKNRCHMKKTLSICRLPPTLIVHLKRFDAFKQKKITTPVTYPARGLNMEPYTRHVDPKPGEEDGDVVSDDMDDDEDGGDSDSNYSSCERVTRHKNCYDLIGMVSHKGSLHQGHYTSYIRVKSSAAADTGSSSESQGSDEGVDLTSVPELKGSLCDRLLMDTSLQQRIQMERGAGPRLDTEGVLGAERRGAAGSSPAGATTEDSGSNRSSSPAAADDSFLHNFEWVKCDDEHVTAVKEEQVLGAEGYILVYMQREVFQAHS